MKIRGQTVHSPQDRVLRMIEVDKETGCWNWQGSKRGGYGRLIAGSRSDGSRKSVSAHRFSFEAFIGQIADGMEVCHACDNRGCVNPAHLFIGTRQDNIDDRERKGRNAPPVGEQNGQSKLSETDVVSARRLRSTGMTFREIAARFGVDHRTIMKAIKGEQWKHVPAAPKPGESKEVG